VRPDSLILLPARNRELDTGILWLRKELVIQRVSLYIFTKADVCKVVDNMPVTLSQKYVKQKSVISDIKILAAATISRSY